jgi:hypothetical protein
VSPAGYVWTLYIAGHLPPSADTELEKALTALAKFMIEAGGRGDSVEDQLCLTVLACMPHSKTQVIVASCSPVGRTAFPLTLCGTVSPGLPPDTRAAPSQ